MFLRLQKPCRRGWVSDFDFILGWSYENGVIAIAIPFTDKETEEYGGHRSHQKSLSSWVTSESVLKCMTMHTGLWALVRTTFCEGDAGEQ